MDNPKNLVYAAMFTLASTYGADFNPMKIPFVADMYKDAQTKAQAMIVTGDVSQLQSLTGMVDTLQAAQNGDVDAILKLAAGQEAAGDGKQLPE